ncbi:dephospho-CoA kinase domain-containing protein isoform X1 [Passer montanus]|uniref:dephospho-CoA kinase domain-containing protein isoform X1 n=1 Tax=Passer montanus TaxID=9160 RepID=UPI00195F3694|nr:dephospho-CoA kinase domain-containing protein isoform X1 [Passer montanus]
MKAAPIGWEGRPLLPAANRRAGHCGAGEAGRRVLQLPPLPAEHHVPGGAVGRDRLGEERGGGGAAGAGLCRGRCRRYRQARCLMFSVVQPHSKAHQQILQHFGTEILLENGEINREALGGIIFSQPEKRRLLNSITHPEILKEMLKQILKYFVLGYRYVILDIPLLFETRGLTRFMKYTVLVYCDPQTQLARLMRRSGLGAAEAEARISSQLPLEEKRRWATHVIDNSGDWESTRRQVLQLHTRLEDSLDFLWARLAVGTAVVGLGGLVFLLIRHFIS